MFKVTRQDSPSSAVFHVNGVDLSVVNSLRRTILAEIPTLAFDDIQILENTSPIHNEFLAHRIGLIPIHVAPSDIHLVQSYVFKINVKNVGNDVVCVTSGDFRGYDPEGNEVDVSGLFPANKITGDHILITKLMPNYYALSNGQSVVMECRTTVNIAKTHARYSNISKCSFMNSLDEEAIAVARKSVTTEKAGRFEHNEKFRIFKKNAWGEPCEFEFYIDTENSMDPVSILKESLTILKQKVAGYLDKEGVTYKELRKGFWEIFIPGEDYTLVNMLQCLTYNYEMRELGSNMNSIEYIGYYQPHPLKEEMILKVALKDGVTDIAEVLKNHRARIIEVLENIHIE